MQSGIFQELQANYLQPHSFYNALRTEHPLVYDQASGFWLVTGYRTITTILKDQRFRATPPSTPQAGSRRSPLHKLIEQQLLFFPHEEHTQAHALLQNALTTVSKTEAARQFIAQVVQETLDNALIRGSMDLIQDFAAPISGQISAYLLGIPYNDLEQLRQWMLWSNAFSDYTSGYRAANIQAISRLQQVFLRLIANRKAQNASSTHPDVLHVLLSHPEYFPDDHVIASNLQMLFAAGRVTGEKAMGEGLFILIKSDLWDSLQAEIATRPQLIQMLTEEWLRYSTPTRYLARWASEEVRIDQYQIHQGQKVILYLEAANYDPDIFRQPECFDSTRRPNPHLAFGHGSHLCPGAGIARTELHEVIRNLFESRICFTLAGEPEYQDNPNLGGLRSCLVTLHKGDDSDA